jgi:hypothetical protein
MPTDRDANGDGNTPEQTPHRNPPPTVEGNESREGGDDESSRSRIQKLYEEPKHWTKYIEPICAIALVGITFYYTKAAFRQAQASEIAAKAAGDAVRVASGTLDETQRSNERQAELAAAARASSDKATAETLKSVESARKSSDAASKQALGATIDNFHKDQRAWVGFTKMEGIPKSGEDFIPTANFINSGRTPAFEVRAVMGGIVDQIGKEPSFQFPPFNENVGSRNQFMPNVPYNNGIYIDWTPQIPQRDFGSRVAAKEVTVYVVGRFDYKDSFGVPHWTTFCQYLTYQFAWVACNHYNESDHN